MGDAGGAWRFVVEVDDGDPDELDRAYRSLAGLLRDADLAVRQESAPLPPGAKGDLGLAQSLVVAVTSGMTPVVAGSLYSWFRERSGRGGKLTVEVGPGIRAEVADPESLETLMAKLDELGFAVDKGGRPDAPGTPRRD